MTHHATTWRTGAALVAALAMALPAVAREPIPIIPLPGPPGGPPRARPTAASATTAAANEPVEDRVVRDLAISVRYGDPATRRRAISALAKLGPTARSAKADLELAAKDADPKIRAAAKAVLEAIRPAPPASRPASRPAGEVVVGVVQVGSASLWRKAQTGSIRTEAKKRGVTLHLIDAQQRQANQIRALRALVARKVDVIALAPLVATGYEPVLREVRQAGVPLILLDRAVEVADASLYQALIRSDFVAQGRAAGQWLAKKTGGKARIVELTGTPGSGAAADRAKGFREVLAKHPGMRILASQSGDFTRAKGKEVMSALLQAHTAAGIDAVYAHNDDMALGAIQAMQEAKVTPGKDILVVSIDGVRKAVEAAVLGDIACTVECTPHIGPALFDTVEAILAGKGVPRDITLPDRVIDAANGAKALEGRDY